MTFDNGVTITASPRGGIDVTRKRGLLATLWDVCRFWWSDTPIVVMRGPISVYCSCGSQVMSVRSDA